MPDRFNPSDALSIGVEWPASRRVLMPVDYGAEIAQIIQPTATMPIRYGGLYLAGPGIGGPPVNFVALCTVYEAGHALRAGVVRTVTSTVNNGSTTGTLNGGAANVADALSTAGDGKSITLAPAGQLARLRYTVPAWAVLRPRVLSVRFEILVIPDPTATSDSVFDVGYRINASGNVVPVGSYVIEPTPSLQLKYIETGELFLGGVDTVANPADLRRQVWTKTDVQNLGGGAVELQITNNGTWSPKLDYARTVVTYCDENRVAVGAIRFSSFNGGLADPTWWYSAELLDPQTKATPVNLVAGRRYIQSWTRASDALMPGAPVDTSLDVQQFGSAQQVAVVAPMGPVEAFVMPRLTDGRVGSTERKTLDGAQATAILDTTGTVLFQYGSQPYVDALAGAAPGSSQIQQEIVSSLGGFYEWLTITCRPIGTPSSLTITVGTSVATVTTAMVEAAMVDDPMMMGGSTAGFVTLTVPLSPGRQFAPGVKQTVTMTVGSGTDRWEVPQLNTGLPSTDTVFSPATYGGIAERGGVGGVFNQSTDFPVVLSMAAPAVTGIAVAHASQVLVPAVTGCPSPVSQYTALDYADITWGDIPLYEGEAYVEFFGVSGNRLSSPSATGSSTAVTGDVTIVARIAPNDWSPAAAMTVGGKWTGTANQRAYRLVLNTTGTLSIFWSTTGVDNPALVSDVDLSALPNGSFKWVAATLDVDNGAGSRTARFWTSDDGTNWTQLGTDRTGSTSGTVFPSSADIAIGANTEGTLEPFDGKISDFRIHATIGASGAVPTGSIVYRLVGRNDIPADTANSFVITSGHTATVSRSGPAATDTLLVPMSNLLVSGGPIVTGFCAWEVQRMDTIDPTWRPIGRVSSQAIREFFDFEGRIGIASTYRVRMCRTDDVCGDWATSSAFTRNTPTTASGACDGFVFASNEDPTTIVAYPLSFEGSGPVLEDFGFPEADLVTFQRLHMRDYVVALRPLERMGVTFSRTLLVNTLSAPSARLARGFQSLRDLAWESLSYVAVLDTRGERWFAAVQVPSGSVRSSNNVYLASVIVTEVTDRPSVVDMVAG